jgi:hypothetical protein
MEQEILVRREQRAESSSFVSSSTTDGTPIRLLSTLFSSALFSSALFSSALFSSTL